MTKQRALDQLARDRGDVDGDERRVGIGRLAMQQSREQFLARAALAEDQHGRRQLRDLVHGLEHVLEGGAWTGDELSTGDVARCILQCQDVPLQILPFAGAAYQVAQHVGIGVLGQEVVGAELDGADGAVNVRRR